MHLLDRIGRACVIAGVVVSTSAALGSAACGRSTPSATAESGDATAGTDAPWPVTVTPLTLPSAAASEPQLTSSNRGTILSWLELTDDTAALKFAEHTAAGWSEARTVTSGKDWFISWVDPPSVLRMRDGTLVATWYVATELKREAYDIRLSYSQDDGQTWSRPLVPHHDRTTTQHGFASLFEQADGGLGMVWLDGRAQNLEADDPGPMNLYYASFDKAWKQTAEDRVNDRVCECCSTSSVATSEGVITAFRDRSPQEIRDIHVMRRENGAWTPPQLVHNDNWMIDACPVNGPMVSARGRQVAAAWFTAKDDKGRAFAAFSNDGGRTWGQPVRLDDQASLGQVDIELLDDGSAAATWMEFTGEGTELRLRRVEPSGARSQAVRVTGDAEARATGHPWLARSGNDVMVAWTEEGRDGSRLRGATVTR